MNENEHIREQNKAFVVFSTCSLQNHVGDCAVLIYSRPPPQRTDGFRFDLRTDGRVGLARKIST
eukprot:UN00825